MGYEAEKEIASLSIMIGHGQYLAISGVVIMTVNLLLACGENLSCMLFKT